jgi:SAM-dependent methyltransferase
MIFGSGKKVRVKGHVDSVTHQGIVGWIAASPDDSNCRYARVFVDGVEIGTVRADQFRPDILNAKISKGFSGFCFRFPAAPDPLFDHKIEVRDRDTGLAISGSPRTLKAMGSGGERTFFDIDPALATAHIRWAIFEQDHWRMAVELLGQKPWPLECRIVHGAALSVEARTERDPFIDRLGIDRKIAQLRVKSDGTAPVMFVDLLGDPSLASSYEPVCRIALPANVPDYMRRISAEHMTRVSGQAVTPDLFAAGGTNTAYRIDSLLRRHFQKGIDAFDRILDWGSGCGRVSLPIREFLAPEVQIVGADVDLFNVEMGKTKFPEVEFIHSPYYPPLPAPDGSFDMAFGISVMTHLTEGAQFAWLKELRRVVKPQAPVILTVHGEYSLFNVGVREPRILHDALERGISDHMLDMNLGPKLSDKSYYRATFHTRRYVLEHWSEHFDILGYYSCGNVVVQDFVVLQAK